MPELPEVTTVINILKQEVVGRKFDEIEILYPKIIKTDLDTFKEKLKNETILDIKRHGKFIVFHLSNDLILISHLRMEGKYSYLNKEDNLPPHTCVIFNFADSTKLVYHDTRKFGIFILTNKDKYLIEDPLKKLGPEPMILRDYKLRNEIYKKLAKNKNIKELLLDQTIMAGIGNIYADEILFASKIHPLTFGSKLTKEQYDLLIDNSIKILTMHKSKGLEYPCVILCNMGKSFNTSAFRADMVINEELGIGINLKDASSRIEYNTIQKNCKERFNRGRKLFCGR